MAMANFGTDHFAAIRLCANPCPNPPPAGYHCIIDCFGDPVLVPINVWEYCDPIMCTQDCGCAFAIFPQPVVWEEPYWLPVNTECVVQFYASEDANWEITEGEDNIIVLPESDDNTLVFLTTHYGPVTVTAEYYCCASGGWCQLWKLETATAMHLARHSLKPQLAQVKHRQVLERTMCSGFHSSTA